MQVQMDVDDDADDLTVLFQLPLADVILPLLGEGYLVREFNLHQFFQKHPSVLNTDVLGSNDP